MFRIIRRSFIAVIVLLTLALLGGYVVLQQSLPQLTGTLTLPGLSSPVTLSRDGLGQAIIQASSQQDAARALGLAHAQDRFFQMDLQRRVAAGELAEWFGPAALEQDKAARFHQFRQRAQRILRQLPETQQALLQAYTDGVNKGLSEMRLAPPEYLLTRFSPRSWQAEDSILVVFSMYLDLQRGQVDHDLARTGVLSHFGADMLAFLTQPSRYQAALDDSEIPQVDVPIPTLPNTLAHASYDELPPLDIGSNNWAVTGALTPSQGAMLANDMHLSLRVPIIWYRTQLSYIHQQTPVTVTGVSLPGMPGVVVGTNGKIAWGFTNANIDNVDWIKLPADEPVWTETESIVVAGDTVTYPLTLSAYGPVRKIAEQNYALAWVAHHDYAVNLTLTELDRAAAVDEALDIASRAGMPLQNLMVVDAEGNAAWTLMGALMSRELASDTALPAPPPFTAALGNDPVRPVVKNPDHGRLWTANARVVSADSLARYGDGGYALGARGLQIRDRLFEHEHFDEQTFYQIQLDNEARFLTPWHQLLTELLSTTADSREQDSLQALADWQACACPTSIGYTLVKAFRQQVVNASLAPVLGELKALGYPTATLLRNAEAPVWQLLSVQPTQWLPEDATDWQSWLLAQYQQSKAKLHAEHGPSLQDLAWGKVNALQVQHPLAAYLPMFGDKLNMPVIEGFGDTYMPSVQATAFGASQRFFVRPDALDKAIMTLPGGQSGHPLSPFYHTGFMQYATHQATPLLPGPVRYQLTLVGG